MSDKYFDDDFLEFVAKTDGSTFKQGSRQNEFRRMITEADLKEIVDALTKRIEKLERRIYTLEKRSKEDEWKTDEWGSFHLPSSNK